MRRLVRVLPALLVTFSLSLLGCNKTEDVSTSTTQTDTGQPRPEIDAGDFKLFETVDAKGNVLRDAVAARASRMALRVVPGSQAEADAYYTAIRRNLADFPQATLQQSTIRDMLTYYGFPALLPKDVESIDPAILMEFARLRTAVSNAAEFQAAYDSNPLQPGEILSVRFFAPKIINVRDPKVDGVPVGGFGWRKIVRFRSRSASAARAAGLDTFYLLFNFTTRQPQFPPAGEHAAQLQAILQPIYPHAGRHRDIYFLVYLPVNDATNPEKVGFFLTATFDLAGVVRDDRYFVPRSCGQCHGTNANDQKRGKVNYLDTDHWIDRTGDDFTEVNPGNVIVDGASAYATFRAVNTEVEQQNAAVIDGGAQFALLAARKWLDLHKIGGGDETRHVPPLKRGFVQNNGDAIWTDGSTPDTQLLPELNRYCFRCHSSLNYHVFQKTAVLGRKDSIIGRLESGSMPQDRVLTDGVRDTIISHVSQLP